MQIQHIREFRMIKPQAGPTLTPSQDTSADDNVLMQAVAKGDRQAFGLLMHRHLAPTVRLATRMIGHETGAEDAAQEAFIRVWKHAPRWEDTETRGAKFTTWLYKILLNIVIDEKRKRNFSSIDDIPEPVDDKKNSEAHMIQQEKSKRVLSAVDDLPERQRMAFLLCFLEGYSNKEAADILGVGIKGLESLLVRARKTLRDTLADMAEEVRK